ncbi:MAG: gliding motility-associated C-terminal domain-containing protein, partial [Bacteroidota bacterium]
SSLTIDLSHYRLYIPNAFSPNADGSNDVFTIFSGPGIEAVTTFQVFDRWGGLLYSSQSTQEESSNTFPSWDGKMDEQLLNAGAYIYHIRALFDDGREREFTGDVMLLK